MLSSCFQDISCQVQDPWEVEVHLSWLARYLRPVVLLAHLVMYEKRGRMSVCPAVPLGAALSNTPPAQHHIHPQLPLPIALSTLHASAPRAPYTQTADLMMHQIRRSAVRAQCNLCMFSMCHARHATLHALKLFPHPAAPTIPALTTHAALRAPGSNTRPREINKNFLPLSCLSDTTYMRGTAHHLHTQN